MTNFPLNLLFVYFDTIIVTIHLLFYQNALSQIQFIEIRFDISVSKYFPFAVSLTSDIVPFFLFCYYNFCFLFCLFAEMRFAIINFCLPIEKCQYNFYFNDLRCEKKWNNEPNTEKKALIPIIGLWIPC